MQMLRHVQQKVFRHSLNAGGDVGVTLIDLAEFVVASRRLAEVLRETRYLCEKLQLTRPRFTKEGDKPLVVSLVSRMVEAEVIHVQRKGSVAVLRDQLPDLVHVTRHAIRGHAHDLVLALVHLETEKCGEGAVEESDRVGKLNLL